ncbi:MAG: hypothetical protein SFU25_04180, partial [Candidatus Caenarcaniphilales bacterium]|nr:hypothetical protein [Candidatus Caenarcaniphilales bacterium]
SELAVLKDGFNNITIGRPDGTGNTNVYTHTFLDPVTVYGNNITLNSTLTAPRMSWIAQNNIALNQGSLVAGSSINLLAGGYISGSGLTNFPRLTAPQIQIIGGRVGSYSSPIGLTISNLTNFSSFIFDGSAQTQYGNLVNYGEITTRLLKDPSGLFYLYPSAALSPISPTSQIMNLSSGMLTLDANTQTQTQSQVVSLQNSFNNTLYVDMDIFIDKGVALNGVEALISESEIEEEQEKITMPTFYENLKLVDVERRGNIVIHIFEEK